jgi:hypothetical protein
LECGRDPRTRISLEATLILNRFGLAYRNELAYLLFTQRAYVTISASRITTFGPLPIYIIGGVSAQREIFISKLTRFVRI